MSVIVKAVPGAGPGEVVEFVGQTAPPQDTLALRSVYLIAVLLASVCRLVAQVAHVPEPLVILKLGSMEPFCAA